MPSTRSQVNQTSTSLNDSNHSINSQSHHRQNKKKKAQKSSSKNAASSINPATNTASTDVNQTISTVEDSPELEQSNPNPSKSASQKNTKISNIVESRFPGLEFDTFEQQLDNWTLTGLQETITAQGSTCSKVSREVKDLVKILRLEFEKHILMVALMAGVPKVVMWNLLGDPPKLPNYSNALFAKSEDTETDENDIENGVNINHFDSPTPTPKVHILSEEEKNKYQPIFDRLVNVDKVHLCHGKPEPSPSVATLQKRSLLAVRKAHQEFSVVCQQHHISYYLTTASCGGVDGWSQTFSNNIKFADWAHKTPRIPAKFTTYVHGKDVAREIEGKDKQPSDERKSRLAHQLNQMMDSHIPGKSFPKIVDPVGHMNNKKWPFWIVQKPGSLLKTKDLYLGHRKATDAVIRVWLKDIEDGLFSIEAKENNNSQLDTNNNPNSQPSLDPTLIVQPKKSKRKKNQTNSESQQSTQKRQKVSSHLENQSKTGLSSNNLSKTSASNSNHPKKKKNQKTSRIQQSTQKGNRSQSGSSSESQPETSSSEDKSKSDSEDSEDSEDESDSDSV
ncbi:hypothetical protein DFH28DRAFT_925644 [Melampsora americana]|nr:hypothetical protein DFH28DRAFT_925644 [Melampsora americana]